MWIGIRTEIFALGALVLGISSAAYAGESKIWSGTEWLDASATHVPVGATKLNTEQSIQIWESAKWISNDLWQSSVYIGSKVWTGSKWIPEAQVAPKMIATKFTLDGRKFDWNGATWKQDTRWKAAKAAKTHAMASSLSGAAGQLSSGGGSNGGGGSNSGGGSNGGGSNGGGSNGGGSNGGGSNGGVSNGGGSSNNSAAKGNSAGKALPNSNASAAGNTAGSNTAAIGNANFAATSQAPGSGQVGTAESAATAASSPTAQNSASQQSSAATTGSAGSAPLSIVAGASIKPNSALTIIPSAVRTLTVQPTVETQFVGTSLTKPIVAPASTPTGVFNTGLSNPGSADVANVGQTQSAPNTDGLVTTVSTQTTTNVQATTATASTSTTAATISSGTTLAQPVSQQSRAQTSANTSLTATTADQAASPDRAVTSDRTVSSNRAASSDRAASRQTASVQQAAARQDVHRTSSLPGVASQHAAGAARHAAPFEAGIPAQTVEFQASEPEETSNRAEEKSIGTNPFAPAISRDASGAF